MNGWSAFRNGLSLSLRYRWVLLILFAANLISAMLLVTLPALSLVGPGHRTAIRQAADGVDAWMVSEAMMSSFTQAALERKGAVTRLYSGLEQGILLAVSTALLLPLVSWLPASFLSGGLLLTYAEALPFRWRRFLWGCWHWFGAFLLLGAVQGVAFVVVFILAVITAVAVIAIAGGWLTWVVVPLLVLMVVLWLALMETTRIVAIVGKTRNVARALGQAARLVFRCFPSIAGLYGLALMLLLPLHALFRGGLMPHLPLDWWPLVLLVQQAFILTRLWARLVRLAGGVTLCQHFLMRD